MYGQLARGDNKDAWLPVKIPLLSNVVYITLGYAHSLFRKSDGSVFGCGAICNGQLGIDPLQKSWSDTLKSPALHQLPMPTPIRLLSSGYFHGVAVSAKGDCLYEWGECPQSLKMRTFLMKRLRSNALKEKKECNEKGVSTTDSVNKHLQPLPSEMPRDYFEVRKLSGSWQQKDKSEPSLVVEPRGVKWVHVQCARNSTTAVAADGRVYVWGRNDKNQLGLGILKKPNSAVRRIVFKATKGPKSVELPDDNHVDVPTVIPGLDVLTHKAISKEDLEAQTMNHLAGADQLALTSVSRFLVKHPSKVFLAAEMHLLAGDLLHALDVLIGICERTGLLAGSSDKSSTSSPMSRTVKSPSPRPTNQGESSRSGGTPILDEDRNGNSPPIPTTTLPLHRPHTLPIPHLTYCWIRLGTWSDCIPSEKLSADPRLCRLIDPYVELGPCEPSSSTSSSINAPIRKLVDLNIRERYSRLKKCSVPQKYMVLRQKCDQLLANDQLRFYSDCCHYEKCVVESGPAKLEFAAIRNRLRKCTKCVLKNRLAGDRSSV
uniref:Uncharacterized protein n=1 Tax=Ditylenchus dipsaci TaxID=166011 RepID=A0A915DC45_9BILA